MLQYKTDIKLLEQTFWLKENLIRIHIKNKSYGIY